jgi:hypothetical protein
MLPCKIYIDNIMHDYSTNNVDNHIKTKYMNKVWQINVLGLN